MGGVRFLPSAHTHVMTQLANLLGGSLELGELNIEVTIFRWGHAMKVALPTHSSVPLEVGRAV